MIVTEIYDGQGLGNQLFCYVTTRTIALDKGYEFGIMNPDKFKCLEFMDLDFGNQVFGGIGPEGGPPLSLPEGIRYYYAEAKSVNQYAGCDIREFDHHLINVADNTKIDGIMQGEDYFIHRKDEIKQWLQVKKDYDCYEFSAENICIINFRGGEYKGISQLYLRDKYWQDSIKAMRKINPNFRFIVITDDVSAGKAAFPDFEVHHFSIAKDYSIIKNSHYAILSNSSFAFFPIWTSPTVKGVIAPKFWARHNISIWSCGYNLYRNWQWMDLDGRLYSYDECIKEKNGDE